jgi:hypothetical protein
MIEGWPQATLIAQTAMAVADAMLAERGRVNGSSREISEAKADALREFAGQFSGYHADAKWYADDICKRLNDAADKIILEANK